MLFLFPSSRRQIIIGKNLVLSLANTVVNLALLLLPHVLMRRETEIMAAMLAEE